jgi:hypothetical protein
MELGAEIHTPLDGGPHRPHRRNLGPHTMVCFPLSQYNLNIMEVWPDPSYWFIWLAIIAGLIRATIWYNSDWRTARCKKVVRCLCMEFLEISALRKDPTSLTAPPFVPDTSCSPTWEP